MKLVIDIWDEHIEVFEHFDLVCHNGHSLEDETRSTALFNAIVTLNRMKDIENNLVKKAEIENSISYLKGSKYYSEMNRDSNY